MGAKLTETCYSMYAKQITGLGPDEAIIDSFYPTNSYNQRPEVAESIFIVRRVLVGSSIYFFFVPQQFLAVF